MYFMDGFSAVNQRNPSAILGKADKCVTLGYNPKASLKTS